MFEINVLITSLSIFNENENSILCPCFLLLYSINKVININGNIVIFFCKFIDLLHIILDDI